VLNQPNVLLVTVLFISHPACAAAQTRPDVARQYGRYLSALHESDLRSSTDTGEVYRALWLRSFHEPISVRIARSREEFFAITVQGGRRDSTKVPSRSWDLLHMRNAMRDFWTTEPTPLPNGAIGVDGARWIVEGRHGRQYHVVDWWSPREGAESVEGAYRRLFLEILSLGTVCVSPDAVY